LSQIYTMDIHTRSYDVGALGTVRTSYIFRYLQEIAREHAAALGVSVLDLQQRGLTWYISRYHLQMDEYPGWGETLTLKTWPSERQTLFSLRDFEIYNGNKCIGRATSSWVVIDLKTKRPVPPAKSLPEIHNNPMRAVDDSFPSLPVPDEWETEKSFTVRMQDIDVNKHVNNVVYIEWALEAIPDEILHTMQPAGVEVSFKGEAFYNDEIVTQSQRLAEADQTTFLHRIIRPADNKELARLRTKWNRSNL